MKLNLVKDIDDVVNPGDACIVLNTIKGQQVKQLVTCCPGCGEVGTSAGSHVYNEETQSYTPSIVHDVNLGGCGWHGWLTNGEFKSV